MAGSNIEFYIWTEKDGTVHYIDPKEVVTARYETEPLKLIPIAKPDIAQTARRIQHMEMHLYQGDLICTCYDVFAVTPREKNMVTKIVHIDGVPVGWAEVEKNEGYIKTTKISSLLIHEDHAARTGTGQYPHVSFGVTDANLDGRIEPTQAGFYRLTGDNSRVFLLTPDKKWCEYDLGGMYRIATWEQIEKLTTTRDLVFING